MNTIQVLDYKPILNQCFDKDSNLVSQWHIEAGNGLENCVNRTYNDLQNLKVEFFKIEQDDRLVGYFAKEKYQNLNCLTGFFLMPEFRTEDGRKEFWQIIQQEFNGPFLCGLYDKNEPAKKFVESQGATFVEKFSIVDGVAVFYKVGA